MGTKMFSNEFDMLTTAVPNDMHVFYTDLYINFNIHVNHVTETGLIIAGNNLPPFFYLYKNKNNFVLPFEALKTWTKIHKKTRINIVCPPDFKRYKVEFNDFQ